MDLPVPEHVRPIRDRFHDFVQERIIPREQEMYSWWVDGDPGAALMAELRAEAKAEGLWASATRRRSAAAACRSWTTCTSTR